MTPDEQRALVQFFGTVHAQAKQTDQMIVGNSQFVKPVSPSIQQGLEQALRIPIQVNQQAPEQQYTHQLPVVEQSQPIEEPQPIQTPVALAPQRDSVVTYTSSNTDVVDILKEINLNLARIGDILEKRNGTSKRTKGPKST